MAYAAFSVVYGEQPSAAKWNILGTNDASFNDGTGIANLATSTTAISNPYKFSAYRNAAWTDGNNTYVKVTFDTELFDTNNNFATGRYTAPITGYYIFSWGVSKIVTGGAAALSVLYKNGASFHKGSESVQGAASVTYTSIGSVLMSLSVSDYVEIYSYGSGGAGNASGTTNTFFTGFLVSQT